MTSSNVLLVISIVIIQLVISHSYSINYFDNNNNIKVQNTGSYFIQSPSSLNVADLCSRLSGNNPILKEDDVNLPFVDSLNSKTTIVEIVGGDIPRSLTQVIKSNDDSIVGPSLDSVVQILNSNGIHLDNKKIIGSNINEVNALLSNINGPVIVLHHESSNNVKRYLSSSSVTPLTEFQISQYQIVLWTAFGVLLILYAAISSIVNMEVIPDSLLYAKFQSARTGKHD